MENEVNNKITQYVVYAGQQDDMHIFGVLSIQANDNGRHSIERYATFNNSLFKSVVVGCVYPCEFEDNKIVYNQKAKPVMNINYIGDKGELMTDLVQQWKLRSHIQKQYTSYMMSVKTTGRYDDFKDFKSYYLSLSKAKQQLLMADFILWLNGYS